MNSSWCFATSSPYDEVTLGAGRIIETLNQPIIIDQHPLQTTGSVGVSLFPRDGSNMVELLKHSDTAMYQAKDRGRNNVQMFSQVMNRKLKHRVAVEASLREALRLKQLDVHYQPFVNLLTRKVVGLEALMRWRHPVHGMVPADQFIPVAEETGLIVPMGNFVLHRTLQNMSAWRKAGVPLVPMSLNIAPAQLQRGELQSTIATLLKTHGLRPEMLQLEMTERAMFDSRAPAGENRQDTMARLRDLGVKIAIDDFGTGYSSLSYLKHWRVDALKIDRSFVRDLVTDSSDLAIVSAIIAIARHLADSGHRRGHRGLSAGGDSAAAGLRRGTGLPVRAAHARRTMRGIARRQRRDRKAGGRGHVGRVQRGTRLSARPERVLFGDAAGQRQGLRARGSVAYPARPRRQGLIGQQGEQAGVGRFDRVERRSMARTAHHHDVRLEFRGQFALFRERGEIVFGRDQQYPARQPSSRSMIAQRASANPMPR